MQNTGHLWLRSRDEWAVMGLPANEAIVLSGHRPVTAAAGEAGGAEARLTYDGARSGWVLTASRWGAVKINGVPLTTGMRVLRDRDEIRVRGPQAHTYYFTTERLAIVEPFPGFGRPTFCSRCKTVIEPGTPAVQCPQSQCGTWVHESEDLGCWSYDAKCPLCPQPTALDAGFQWSPDQLEEVAS